MRLTKPVDFEPKHRILSMSLIYKYLMVNVAQLVEHQVVALGVVGSSPTVHPSLRQSAYGGHWLPFTPNGFIGLRRLAKPDIAEGDDRLPPADREDNVFAKTVRRSSRNEEIELLRRKA